MHITGKTYRIKSGFRFTIFIAIVIVVVVMMSNTVLGLNNASSLTQQKFIEYEVQSGDTLWDIAVQYMPTDTDIRESVYMLRQTNEITSSQIYPGQILQIPVHTI